MSYLFISEVVELLLHVSEVVKLLLHTCEMVELVLLIRDLVYFVLPVSEVVEHTQHHITGEGLQGPELLVVRHPAPCLLPPASCSLLLVTPPSLSLVSLCVNRQHFMLHCHCFLLKEASL